jgi:16S rRNA (adenine1518-N6/adenine1519-N6)-dimethyltransferase
VSGEQRLPPPRKRFGQHFLTDPASLRRIVDALSPESSDVVLEIGPGKGALSDALLSRCRRLVAIEIDRDLVKYLRHKYADRQNVEIVEADALETDWSAITGPSYLLAGNLPYYITTPLIFRILEHPRPRRAVLLVQREVAERLTADAGRGEYGALTVNVQSSATVRIVGHVSAGSFHPKPKVDSSIVMLTPLPEPLLGTDEEVPFRRFVQAVFGMRRKTLLRVLRELRSEDAGRAAEILDSLGLEPSMRPEVVGPSDFVRLFRALR